MLNKSLIVLVFFAATFTFTEKTAVHARPIKTLSDLLGVFFQRLFSTIWETGGVVLKQSGIAISNVTQTLMRDVPQTVKENWDNFNKIKDFIFDMIHKSAGRVKGRVARRFGVTPSPAAGATVPPKK